MTGNGKNVLKLNFARYTDQLGTGSLSSTYNTVGLTQVRYPWIDVNVDWQDPWATTFSDAEDVWMRLQNGMAVDEDIDGVAVVVLGSR